ncbi:MAG: LysE family transporter [Paludibacteraceae bacterium]|nr:LysE family transporter [Paludibacteraceae bacterium]
MSFIHLVLNCFIIGILTSIPMGPLGVVCIHRTLSKGRQHGFVTGLGAATSDLVYASLIGFSMSYVLDFIHSHEILIKFISCGIILAFGLITLFQDPKKQLERRKDATTTNDSLLKDYLSAFGLCITNPMISVFFIALFAQFNIFADNQPFYRSVATLLLIFCGASTCWFTLSYYVDKFRERINERGTSIMNKIAGTLLLTIGIWGIITTIVNNYL